MSLELDKTVHASADDIVAEGLQLLPVRSLFAGRYLIEAFLGRGGMGTVYRARDEKLGETIALKTLSLNGDVASERFYREVRLARRVTHPNVVRTHDLGEHEGIQFLTMELVRGMPLDELLQRRGILSPERVGAIGEQIALGLEAAHAAGIVHRDLKPANVLLAKNGRVMLSDFGVARAFAGDQRARETAPLIGTPYYMAPEQVLGLEVDARTDIYAAGVMLYELSTGTLPFDGDNPFAVAVARLKQPVEDPRKRGSVPDSLAEVILSCMAREPDSRLGSASALREALAGRVVTKPAESRSGPGSHFAPLATAERTVAVLPFTYRGEAAQAYLGEAMAEELIDVLSRTRGLRVLALGATRAHADSRDPMRLTAELGCDSVIDGTIQMVGGSRMRLSARLYEHEGVQHWSDRFEGAFTDLFDIQESMGRRVAEALRLELSTSAYRHRTPREALSLYLRARRILRRGFMNESERAVEMLDQALTLAPDFHPAIAAHAFASIRAWWSTARTKREVRAKRAEESCQRALELVPELAEAHLARGMLATQHGRFSEAVAALAHALEIAPTMADAQQYLGELQLEAGYVSEGRERLELALQLDPTLEVVHLGLARSALLHGEEEAYLEHVEKLNRAYPHPPLGVVVSKLRWAMMRDEKEEALPLLQTLKGMETPAGQSSYALVRLAYGEGSFEEVRAARAADPGYIDNQRFRSLMRQIASEIFALSGALEAALEELEAAAEGALIDVVWMRRYPHFAPLRDHPRYRAALDKVATRARNIWRRS